MKQRNFKKILFSSLSLVVIFVVISSLINVTSTTKQKDYEFKNMTNFGYPDEGYSHSLKDLTFEISSGQKQGSNLFLGTNSNNINKGVLGKNSDDEFQNIKSLLQADSIKNQVSYTSAKQCYVMQLNNDIENVGGLELFWSGATSSVVFDMYVYVLEVGDTTYQRYSFKDIDMSFEFERKIRVDFDELITIDYFAFIAIPRSGNTATIQFSSFTIYNELSDNCTITLYDDQKYEIHDEVTRNSIFGEDYPLDKNGYIFIGWMAENEDVLFDVYTRIINKTFNLFAVYEYNDDFATKKITIKSNNIDYTGYSDIFKDTKNIENYTFSYKQARVGTNSTIQINNGFELVNKGSISQLKRIIVIFDETISNVNNIKEMSITYGVNSSNENLGVYDNIQSNYSLSLNITNNNASHLKITKKDSGALYIKEIIIEVAVEQELTSDVYAQASLEVIDGRVNLRFVGTSNTYYNIYEIGFEMWLILPDGDKYNYVTCSSLYNSISASKNGVNKKITADELNAKYLFAYTIKGVPINITIKVSSYIITNDDIIMSEEKTYHIDSLGVLSRIE